MQILIADDDLVSRSIVESLLVKWGYEVTVACDGTEACQVLQQEKAPKIAILDWMMPGMSGVQVLGIPVEEKPQAPRISAPVG